MDHHSPIPSTINDRWSTRVSWLRTLALLATIGGGTLLTACSSTSEAVPCKGTVRGDHEAAIMLLADGRSQALTAAVSTIADDPDAAFSSPDLDFGPISDEADMPRGVVLLATYDNSGNVTTHGTYDLTGLGNDDRIREHSRRRQAECLSEAIAALPEPSGESADLLRTLRRASAIAVDQASAGHAAVVATGLGRSSIDGHAIDELDLSPEGQEQVFAELGQVGLVPDLSSSGAAILFLDPSEDVASSVSAQGVESFARSLCERTGASPCTSGPTLN